jgi:ubiquinone biosynthesis UbiH/UbiF/VisC/COQ6 family hydroxylase
MHFRPSPATAQPPSTQNTVSTHVDICVLGGGAVASVAMLLARAQGLTALQILPHPFAINSDAVPRTYAISPKSQTGLASLGIWGLLPTTQVKLCTDMRVFWQGGAMPDDVEPIHLSAAQAGVEQLCSFVSEHDLLVALNTAMTVAGVIKAQSFYSSAQAPQLAQTAQGIHITQAGDAQVLAKLCVIAEGAGSRSAAQLGLAPTVYDYGHSAVVAILHSDAEQSNHTAWQYHTAWQWLGASAQGHDVLALLPLPPNALAAVRYGLVWSQPSAQAAQWCAAAQRGDHSNLLVAIQARCGSQVGQLSLHSAVQQFPLTRHVAPSVIAPHVALVGDSAHKIHPLAGQGLNLGFEDVFTLFDVLAHRESWRGVGDARLLARYQRLRTAHAKPMDAAVHGIANRGQWNSGARHLAQIVLRAHNDFATMGTWVKRQLVRRVVR